MKISIANLPEGLSQLYFQVKPEELGFDLDPETQTLFPNDIGVEVEVQKYSEEYFIQAKLTTQAHYVCDRCLDEFDRELLADFRLVYSKHARAREADDDYRFFGEDTAEIDLSRDVRENLLLVIPMKHLCSEDCQGLCPHCGINLNHGTCNCESETIDPRWEVLRRLQSAK